MAGVCRTMGEIEDLRGDVIEVQTERGTKFPGMSYEEGILAALDWLLGDTNEYPMEE